MEKTSVTLTHREGYLVTGLTFGGALLAIVLNTVMPSAQRDERVLGYVIAAIAVVIGVVFLFEARRSESLDEGGITIRSSSKVKHYGWDEIGKVGVIAPQCKDLPKLRFWTADGQHIAYIDYTKRTLACVRAYYGEPDEDRWGKPPAVH